MVLGVVENESGFPVTNHFASPGMGAGNDWEAARHSFENGKTERVLQERGQHIDQQLHKRRTRPLKAFSKRMRPCKAELLNEGRNKSGLSLPTTSTRKGRSESKAQT